MLCSFSRLLWLFRMKLLHFQMIKQKNFFQALAGADQSVGALSQEQKPAARSPRRCIREATNTEPYRNTCSSVYVEWLQQGPNGLRKLKNVVPGSLQRKSAHLRSIQSLLIIRGSACSYLVSPAQSVSSLPYPGIFG